MRNDKAENNVTEKRGVLREALECHILDTALDVRQ